MESQVGLFTAAASSSYALSEFNQNIETLRSTNIYRQDDKNGTRTTYFSETTETLYSDTFLHSSPHRTPILRLVTLPLTVTKIPHQVEVRKDIFHSLLKVMDLEPLYQYAHCAPQAFNIFPQHDSGGYRACFFIHMYFGLYMSYDSKTRTTNALCWCGGDTILPVLEECLLAAKSLVVHPCYLLTMMTATFVRRIDARLTDGEKQISEVEQRTGYHPWKKHYDSIAQGELGDLSAKMSGWTTILAANKRLVGMSNDVMNACKGETLQRMITQEERAAAHSEVDDTTTAIKEYMEHLERHFSTTSVCLNYMLARAQNQLTALFNLSKQRDMALSISIAKSSTALAAASKRDSSSMKTLAAVTVVFLPGTFISSLFSMSMFTWTDNGSSVIAPGLWMYWAITGPLTLLTIIAWLAWTRWRARSFKLEDESKENLNGYAGLKDRESSC